MKKHSFKLQSWRGFTLKIWTFLILVLLWGAAGCDVQTQPIGTETKSSPTIQPTPSPLPLAFQLKPISPGTADQLILLTKLAGHEERIYGLALSRPGKTLASGSSDGTIQLWDLNSLENKGSQPVTGSWDVYFAPDDSHLATDQGTVWDIDQGEKGFELAGYRTRAAFSRDGRWMAATGFTTPIQIWNTSTWQVESTLAGHTDRIFGMVFSPDNRLLVTGSGLGPTDVSDFVVKVWDISSGTEIHTLTGHLGDIHAVDVSPDSTLIASASTDFTVKVWDTASGELLHNMRHRDGLFDVVFSPDGRLLASAGVDRTVKIWDSETGNQLISLRHEDEVMAVVFTPDNRMLISGGYDGEIYLWGIPVVGE